MEENKELESYEMTNEEFKNAMTENGKVQVEYIYVSFKERYNDTEYDGDRFLYRKPATMDLRKGDYVVVETRYGLALAMVVQTNVSSVNEDEFERFYNDIMKSKIVQKVDYENYFDRKQRIARMKQLKNKLNTYTKKVDEIQRFESMVQFFPELKDDFEEFKKLAGEYNEQA